MGLHLLARAAALLQWRVDNVPVLLDAVRDGDCYNPGWESAAQGTPNAGAYLSGLNLVGVTPPPSATAATFTATVVENAPLPSAPTDDVQVGRDDLDALIDYTVHLAMLKCGGAEFQSTLPLFDRFLKQAEVYGLKLAELGEFTRPLLGQSQREDDRNPRTAAPIGADQ